jgi:metal-responsive CopG/Arc/MetJ family transcriptional regulator
MARTSTKRKAAAKPPPKLRGSRQPLAISLPPELVVEIDAIAAGLERSRVKVIEFACREYVERHQQRRSAA